MNMWVSISVPPEEPSANWNGNMWLAILMDRFCTMCLAMSRLSDRPMPIGLSFLDLLDLCAVL